MVRKQLPNLCCQIFKHLLLIGEGASLLGRIFSPRLFSSIEIISIRKNFLPEIIFIGRNHLYPQKFPVRDYFHRQKSSLSAKTSCQGLFPSVEIISIRRNFLSGIIFIGRNHLYSQDMTFGQYFSVLLLFCHSPNGYNHKYRPDLLQISKSERISDEYHTEG